MSRAKKGTTSEGQVPVQQEAAVSPFPTEQLLKEIQESVKVASKENLNSSTPLVYLISRQEESASIYDDLSTLRCAMNSVDSPQTKVGQLSVSKLCTYLALYLFRVTALRWGQTREINPIQNVHSRGHGQF